MLLCVVVGSSFITAQAQKIKVQYDPSLDFTKFKTYSVDPVDAGSKPMLRLAVQAAVEYDLNRLGLTKVAANPDLVVQMYGATDQDLTFNYHDPIYGGYNPPVNTIILWHNIPGTTTTVVIHKGELVVDLLDANRKHLVWRGVAKQNLSDSREKLLKQVNTAVEKMFLQYPVGNK
jgi:Domain of unknown function (DUF4136)